jgi:hypothetical protein
MKKKAGNNPGLFHVCRNSTASAVRDQRHSTLVIS